MDFEQQARLRKARKIAAYCQENYIRPEVLTHDDLPAVQAALRATICTNAGVNLASDETWAVVIGLLGATEQMTDSQRASYERAAHGDGGGGDPWVGLPS